MPIWEQRKEFYVSIDRTPEDSGHDNFRNMMVVLKYRAPFTFMEAERDTHTHPHTHPPHTHLLLFTLLTPITPPCLQSFIQPGHSEHFHPATTTSVTPQLCGQNAGGAAFSRVLLWDVKMPSSSGRPEMR